MSKGGPGNLLGMQVLRPAPDLWHQKLCECGPAVYILISCPGDLDVKSKDHCLRACSMGTTFSKLEVYCPQTRVWNFLISWDHQVFRSNKPHHWLCSLDKMQSQCRRCRRRGFDPWVGMRKKWQPIPVFLPGESRGQGSLAGYSPWDRKESNTTTHVYTRIPLPFKLPWKCRAFSSLLGGFSFWSLPLNH